MPGGWGRRTIGLGPIWNHCDSERGKWSLPKKTGCRRKIKESTGPLFPCKPQHLEGKKERGLHRGRLEGWMENWGP